MKWKKKITKSGKSKTKANKIYVITLSEVFLSVSINNITIGLFDKIYYPFKSDLRVVWLQLKQHFYYRILHVNSYMFIKYFIQREALIQVQHDSCKK